MSEPSRRDLIRQAAMLAVLAACSTTDSDDTGVDTGPLDSGETDDTEPPPPPWCDVVAGDASSGWLAVPLADHRALANVGGSTTLVLGGERMNVVHVEQDCFVAMGTVCTHEGCAVEVRSGARFVCPCHGALYNWLGEPIAGPAPDPLPTWPAALRDGAVWVQVG